MSVSKLSIGDFRSILAISAELHNLQMSDQALEAALQQLLHLTSAKGAVLQLASGLLPQSQLQVCLSLSAGLDETSDLRPDVLTNRCLKKHPLMRHLAQRPARPEPVTLLRQQLLDDANWYSSEFFTGWCSPAAVDHCILSAVALPRPGWVAVLELYRPYGSARLFADRELAVAHLVQLEFGRHLLKHPAYTLSPTASINLTPRMQHVLKFLLAGSSEKEVAQQLGLSIHTVHTYCVALYRRHGVHSRGELMSRFVRMSNVPVAENGANA